MKLKGVTILSFLILLFGAKPDVLAQERPISDFFPEIKVLADNGPAEGYYFLGSKGLTAANASHYIAIVDNYGTPVFFRKMKKATSSFRKLNNGRLAYLHGVPRKWYLLDEALSVEKVVSVEGYKPNGHDWDYSDDGHLLLMGESKSTVDMSLLVDGGNPNAEVLDLVVQEFDENFNLVSTWNSADHFSIFDGNDDSPYLDFTEKQIDYVHANAISVDSDTSFLISSRHMDEITKVHRLTGEVIWRLGGKNNQFQFIGDDIGFSHQHSIRKLENGNILLFDNGNLHNTQLSSAVEYRLDEQEKTATLVKRFYRDSAVYSNHQGATQRLPNGNTIVNWGPYWPSFTEFHPDGTTAMEWDFTRHSFSPKIEKYSWENPVFTVAAQRIDLGTLESDSIFSEITVRNLSGDSIVITGVGSRTAFFGPKTGFPVVVGGGDSTRLEIWFAPGDAETGYFEDVLTIASDSETERLACQVKVVARKDDPVPPVARLLSTDSGLPVDKKVVLEFSERIKGSQELDYASIDDYVVVRKNDAEGEPVDVDATISSDKTTVTISPALQWDDQEVYYISLKEGLTDYSENPLVPFEAFFTTVISSAERLPAVGEAGLMVYPNPVTDRLTIKWGKGQGEVRCLVTNINGVSVLERSAGPEMALLEMDLGHLQSGYYILRVAGKNFTKTKRIIKH